MKDFLSNSLFHSTTKGRYFTDTKVVGIDFIGNLYNSGDTASTLIHETVHVYLCNNTEMGIFLTDVEKHIHKFTHISTDEQKHMLHVIFESQQMVQEGYATFMQFAILRKKLNIKQQREWLNRVPDSYRRWLRPFLFSFRLPLEQREKLNLLVILAMNTNIRKDTEKYHLLDDSSGLEKYLDDENNNPSIRIKKMLKTVKKNPILLDDDLNNIAKFSGIKIFERVEKKDIVPYINYFNNKMGITQKITEEQIGDVPSVERIFKHVQDNTIITNLNINLDKNAEYLHKVQDVIHYSDRIERILAIYLTEDTLIDARQLQILSPDIFDEDPQLTLILQTTTGEKYLYTTSVNRATELLNNELSNAILCVKFGDYNLKDDKIYWLPQVRPPNLIIFNHYWQMNNFLSEHIVSDKNAKFEHCHIGFESGMANIFLVKIHGKTPLLSVNIVFPIQVNKVLETIKERSVENSNSLVKTYTRQLNSHLILWSGFDHRIDWVEALIEANPNKSDTS